MPLERSTILQASQLDDLEVIVFQSLPSTNSWMLSHPVLPGHAALCVTENQTAGRGRRGNIWHSSPTRNITMSLGWCYSSWPERITGLSLTVGMVIAEHLNRAFEIGAKVKWPNDITVADKKLGGILIELAGRADAECQLVIGVGLNVEQAPLVDAEADYDITDLVAQGVTVDRNQLIGELARELCAAAVAFEEKGFKPLLNVWPDYCSFAGRPIRIDNEGTSFSGQSLGVNEDGAMLVKDKMGQIHTLNDSAARIRLAS